MLNSQLSFFAELDDTQLPDNVLYLTGWETFKPKWQIAKYYALDIETKCITDKRDGLNPYRNRIRLIQIGLSDESVYVCDLDKDPNKEAFLELLKETLEDSTKIKVLHNSYFDLLHLKVHFNMDAHGIRDTMIFSKILLAGVKGFNNHSLKAVAARYKIDVDKTEQTSDWSMPNLSNSQICYAALDVIATLKLFRILGSEIKNHNQRSLFNKKPLYTLAEIATIECESIPAFVECTVNGLPVDLIRANEILTAYQSALEQIKAPIEEIIGMPYTAASTKLIPKLSEYFGISLEIENGSKYAQSANSSALFKASQDHPILLNLILARSLKQSIDAIKKIIACANAYTDQRVRGWFTVLGDTGTGRSTCSSGGKKSNFAGINCQNIPKDIEHPLLEPFNLPSIRSCIKADNEHLLAIIDLAASHQRFVASKRLSGDKFLQKVLLDPDMAKLSHSILAADIAKLKGLDYTPEYIETNRKTNKDLDKLRSVSKTRFYSGLNMAGWRRVQAALQGDFIVCSDEDAKASSKAFNTRYAGIYAFQRKTQRVLQSAPRVIHNFENYIQFTTADGRLYHCLLRPSKLEGDSINISDALAIQWLSPEAIAMKQAMINFRKWCSEVGSTAKLLAMVHDELVLEADKEDLSSIQKLAELIAEAFQYVLGSDIPHGVCLDPLKLIANNYSEK